MGDVSKYFDRDEFECKCGCGFAAVDVELLKVLNELREHFGRATSFNSACRCYRHNEKVQKVVNKNYVEGSSKSKHMQGIAVDVVVSNVSPDNVAKYLEEKYPNKYGIGRYKTFTHLDVRASKARWDYR